MWLRDAQIVLPDRVLERASLRIEGQQITAVVEDVPQPAAREMAVDARGLIVIPGIVDLHGDMIEHEIEPRPGARFPLDMAIHELDKRMAACGVTTAYAAISFWGEEADEALSSGAHAHALVTAINSLRGSLLVDLFVHARYEVPTPSVAPALFALLEARQIQLLSLMDHTPGQGQYRDLERFVAYIAKWRNADPDQIAVETRERMLRVQNQPSIWATANELVSAALEQGVLIASHDDDTPAKIDLMADFRVTISEFPVTLEAALEARQRGMHVVMGAPNVLRGISHSGNLSALEAIAAGAVDALASDYSPAALVQAAFAIVRAGLLPLHDAMKLIGQNPATALNLHDRGCIAVDKLADITLVEPGACARVRGTIRRGLPIYWDSVMAQRSAIASA
ncbi:MAG: alpha-D-ribose 1-methylphosphonate 5-triphosphate diphosphatase [Roseiflexaceae bacterium]|nr:alpha-D-ribose 1-methylphosphonate 5-triphosphate diphosphatase [Roseiflexaceae bacterium]